MSPFTPFSIKQRHYRKKVALFLVVALSPLVFYHLTIPAGANETIRWDSTNFGFGTTASTTLTDVVILHPNGIQIDDSVEEFRLGNISSNNFEQTAVTTDGAVSISQVYTYDSEYLLGTDIRDVLVRGNYIYISSGRTATNDGGLQVIDTNGTFDDPSDDTIAATYNATSSPPIDIGLVNSVRFEGDNMYIHFRGSMLVIDTKGTVDQTDDEIIGDYAGVGSDNPIVSGRWVWDSESIGDILAVGSTIDLLIVDTNGTATTSDDVVGGFYNDATPIALADRSVRGVHAIGNTLYLETFAGLYAIDTNGTATTSDDVFGGVHSKSTSGLLPDDFVSDMFVEGNLLYIAGNGVVVIDTQGTATIADDELVSDYASDVRFSEEFQSDVEKSGDILYIDGETIQVIDTQGTTDITDDVLIDQINGKLYNPAVSEDLIVSASGKNILAYNLADHYMSEGRYISNAFEIVDTRPTALSTLAAIGAGESSKTSYRISQNDDAIYVDDFGTDDAYLGDFYGYGGDYDWQSVVAEDGVLRASGEPSVVPSYAYFVLSTGFMDDYLEADSIVSVRYRVLNRPDEDMDFGIFTDLYESGTYTFVGNDQWQIESFSSEEPFSNIIIELFTYSGADLDDTILEIDYIQITTPDSMGFWDAWQPCTDLELCAIGDTGTSSWFQYRLDLSTTDQSSSPLVSSVELRGDYATSGTYTSAVYEFDRSHRLEEFNANIAASASTSVSFEYSIDRGASWVSVTAGSDLGDIEADSFQWRATLNTIDPLYSPTISEVTLEADEIRPTTGTSLRTQIERMERSASAEQSEFISQIRKDHPRVFEGTASAAEVNYVRLKLIKEALLRFDELLKLRAEEEQDD